MGLDAQAVARWRLRTQGLADRPLPDPVSVVGHLLGVQAENFAQACWALAARVDGEVVEDDVGALFDAGAILRTHILRPTWHFVLPAELGWVQRLTGPRWRRATTSLRRQLGLEADVIARAVDTVVAALSEGEHRTRAELAGRLADAGLPSEGLGLAVVLGEAEAAGLVCSGARRDGDHTWALLEERAPGGRWLEPTEALGELVFRYLQGHGPATERDVAYWATLPLGQVRTGLEAAGARLEQAAHDGSTMWFVPPLDPPEGPPSPRGHLLQTLDEIHNGYQHSRLVIDAAGLLPRRRPPAIGLALVDGQVVGFMRRRVTPTTVRFDVDPLRPLGVDERAALDDAATRYGRFLTRTPELRLST